MIARSRARAHVENLAKHHNHKETIVSVNAADLCRMFLYIYIYTYKYIYIYKQKMHKSLQSVSMSCVRFMVASESASRRLVIERARASLIGQRIAIVVSDKMSDKMSKGGLKRLAAVVSTIAIYSRV